VQFFDGQSQIETVPQLASLSGSFSAITWGIDAAHSNAWSFALTGRPPVSFGLTILVLVQFGGDENSNQIIFRAAGADF
jgi:hypothetical protein